MVLQSNIGLCKI